MENIIFLFVVLITNGIQAITGFAGTLLAMPPSMALVGVEPAKAILNVLAMVSCLLIAVRNLKSVNWKELGRMISFMFLGMGIGMVIYQFGDTEILFILYGVLIVGIALKNMFFHKETVLKRWQSVVILLGAGVIHGMFVSGGALLVVYAAFKLKDKDTFRATVAPVWVILNFFMLFQHIASGYFTPKVTGLTFLSLVPMAAGVWVGNRLQKRINQSVFMRLTYLLLFLSGASLLVP